MKFGFDDRKHFTGAAFSVCLTQSAAVLPLLYLVLASGWHTILVEKTGFSLLFDLGVSTIPRALALAMSLLYRHTGSEVFFSLLLAALALAYGLVMRRLLQGQHGRAVRIVFAALIGLDLAARLLPLRFAASFGLPVTILAFALRAGCLILILLDLKAKEP